MEQNEILTILGLELPDIAMSSDKENLAFYGRDSYMNYVPNASAILFPKTTKEVQQIIYCANKYNFKIVPSGGRTGLSGGATAVNGEVVVSMNKMNRILAIDDIDKTITAQSGVTIQEIQNAAEERNLYYPIEYAAVGTSQVGGNIATNAGGIHVIRYGMTREWVKGLQVVTGNGDILNLNKGLVKNNSGLDFRHLFIGSEGIIGIITEATLQLTNKPTRKSTYLLGLAKIENVVDLLSFIRTKTQLHAFEFFSDEALSHALEEKSTFYPLAARYNYYVILEYESSHTIEHDSKLMDDPFLSMIKNQNGIIDGTQTFEPKVQELIWKIRENIPSSLNRKSPYKFDISVRPSFIPAFIDELEGWRTMNDVSLELILFGHVGDGNIHINIPKPEKMDLNNFMSLCHQKGEAIYRLLEKYQGSVSAEHGIGLSKKNILHITKSSFEIDAMVEIKHIFDRNNILNPGKIINDESKK